MDKVVTLTPWQLAAARVARGAALLDEKRPGWAGEIDVGKLDVAECRRCMLGQLFNGYSIGDLKLFPTNNQSAGRHGFIATICEEEYAVLQTCWLAEIAKRTGGAE